MHRHHGHRRELGHKDDDGHRKRSRHEDEKQDARASPSEPGREGSLGRGCVRLDIAQVVEDQDRRREETQPGAHEDADRCDAANLQVDGANGRDQAEEDEDEELAQTEVAIRPRTAGVKPARQQAGRSHHEQSPVDREADRKPRHSRDAERGDRGPAHLGGFDHAGGGRSEWTDAARVGAADVVRIVVGEVDPDLHAEGDDQRGEPRPPAQAALVHRDRGPRQHRRDRSGERDRPHRRPPHARSPELGRCRDHMRA